MENPPDDVTVRFKMPAQRGSPDTSDPARFHVPAQNPANRIGEDEMDEMDEDGAHNGESDGDEDMPGEAGEDDNDEIMMRDVITVECQKLNGRQFIGTVNFSEAKVKIFQDGLGLDAGLLGTVKITFNKCPVVTFKLKSKINVTNGIKNLHPKFTRTYHSKGELKTDTITCNVLGIRQNVKRHTRSQIPRRIQEESQIKEVMVKIEGCDSIEAACKVKNCLSYYGEILSDITEKCHYDPDPNALPVGNGSYQVKMKLKREIPNFIPAAGNKIRISYTGCIFLCSNCFRVHSRRSCKNEKVMWK